jgi:ATP-dependent helicase/DNAse subunit B
MQLPVYIYLIKNSNIIKNVRIGGFYLQKILNNELDEEEKKKSLKLQGYSNSDINVLEKVDSSYNDSNVIKGLKTSSNGFYSYSKVISDEDIDKLNKIVDKNIRKASNKIVSNEFDINPKEIDGKNVGCLYCEYRDICFVKNDDVVSLPKAGNIFEGGEEDGMD